MHFSARLLVLPAALLSLAACQNTQRGLREDADRNKRVAKNVADDVQRNLKDGAKTAEAAADKAVSDAAQTVQGARITLRIASTLAATPKIDAAGIDVVVDEKTRTVHLRGHVPDAIQKPLAVAVATDHAEGYAVSDELAVKPR